MYSCFLNKAQSYTERNMNTELFITGFSREKTFYTQLLLQYPKELNSVSDLL